ncbi:hypothetical protein CH380_02450 [Leptospira adleri]|uniref:Uncharacterized protein n=1 Tax=Leptospira adleri TaxID=2023186 RepID=A0A2M9YSU6_9LEPT|nr:hypothetical protein CH380_02450 [Leptospira adleri]PJZ59852.1 hypothetical protein CH376_21560 [Leptospira adleri]
MDSLGLKKGYRPNFADDRFVRADLLPSPFLFSNFGNCASASKKFFRLKETNLRFSILYILRPSQTPLAL